MTDLICPVCGVEVPDTGISSSYGTGGAGGDISLHESRQHSTCENGHRLVRNPESSVESLRQWRINEAEAQQDD